MDRSLYGTLIEQPSKEPVPAPPVVAAAPTLAQPLQPQPPQVQQTIVNHRLPDLKAVRDEYHTILVDALLPVVTDLLFDMYKDAVNLAEQTKEGEALAIFQALLKEMPGKWPEKVFEEELEKVEKKVPLRKLLKQIVITTCMILTSVRFGAITNSKEDKFEAVVLSNADFLRCLLTNVSKYFQERVYLFDHTPPIAERTQNQIMIEKRLERRIIPQAVRKCVPIEDIVDDFLRIAAEIAEEEEETRRVREHRQKRVQKTFNEGGAAATAAADVDDGASDAGSDFGDSDADGDADGDGDEK